MDEDLLGRAVAALQAYHAKVRLKGKPKLIDDNPAVSIIIALKKIPQRTIRPHRIPLLHTLYPEEETEMCLITKDDKAAVKSLLEQKKVCGVTKVIPLAKLKTNYKSYELKRRLSNSYDIFLTDKRLYHLLPRLLGNKFFEKKKFPFPVDLRKEDLASEISRTRDATYLHVGLGSCCSLLIGRVGFPAMHLVENVSVAMKGVSNRIPRGWSNIQSIHIKSVDSIALPVYTSLPPAPTQISLPPAHTRISRVSEQPPVKRVKLTGVASESEGEEKEGDVHVGTATEDGGHDKKRSLGNKGIHKFGAKRIRGCTVTSEKSKRTGKKRRLN